MKTSLVLFFLLPLALGAVLPFFSSELKKIETDINGILGHVQSTVKNFKDEIENKIKTEVNDVEQLKVQLQTCIRLGKLKEKVENNIVTPIQEKFDQIKNKVTQIETDLYDSMKKTQAAIEAKLGLVGQDVNKTEHLSFLSKIKSKIDQSINEAKNSIHAFEQEIKEKIKSQADKVEQLKSDLQTCMKLGKLKYVADNKVQRIETNLENIWEKIKSAIKEKIASASNDLNNLKKNVVQKYETVKEVIKATLAKIKNEISEKLSEAKMEFEKLHQASISEIAHLEQEVAQKYNSIKDTARETLDQAKNRLLDQLHKANERLTQAENHLKEKLDQAEKEFEKLEKEVEQKYDQEVDKIKEALSKIENELKDQLVKAQEEYTKVKDEVKGELKKIEDEIKRVMG